ncbi:MAG: DMT family transporter [Deltaproteobacteria bacterium]|nr:DMT family transporter [Deltaproteobacteria bacterium]
MKNGRANALLSLHLAVFLFGAAGLFARWVDAPPLLIVLGRVLVATLAFSLFLLIRGWQPRRPPGDHRLMALCGGLLAFHWFAFFTAIKASSVALGLLSYSTAPVFVALLEPAVFPEKLSTRTVAASLVSLLGVLILLEPWGGISGTWRGVSWGVLSGFSFALLSLLNRQLVQRHDPVRVAMRQDAWAMVFLLPALPWAWSPLSWRELGLLAVLGVVCTALAHTLFINSLKNIRASLAAMTSALEPVYGILLALFLLGEYPSAGAVAGGALIIIALLMAGPGEEPPASLPADKAPVRS